jgi:hypothetical protein
MSFSELRSACARLGRWTSWVVVVVGVSVVDITAS